MLVRNHAALVATFPSGISRKSFVFHNAGFFVVVFGDREGTLLSS